jgi:serine/threonine-protein kinase
MAWPEVPGGRYEVAEVVGQGGMGTVYRAMDVVLGREVALKVLRPEAADDALAERLRREARILAQLEHPGIVPVHDAGVLADGRVYYVMKLVRGVRLDEFVAGISRSEMLRAFLRVLDTIGFAHARGIIHRDLKPANIMVGGFGEILVLDWGIARRIGDTEASLIADPPRDGTRRPGDTAPGVVLGTPGFMAPEQARGEVETLDQRADVHALGAILRGLCGQEPIPRPLASIISKAAAPTPDCRYPTVADLSRDIVRFMDGDPVSAHRETVPERLERLYRRYQTPILLVVAYLTMRLLFLVLRGI